MLSKLNELVAAKKSNLLQIANTINAKKAESQSKLNECELKVTKPTKIHELDSRIEEISGIAKEIENVELVTMEHDAIRNKKINVTLKTDALVADISGFGSVSVGPVPVLLSLTDNRDASVSVEWKLKEQQSANSDNQGHKLKIEWSETKSDDLAQFEEKWEHHKEVEVGGGTETTTTKVTIRNKAGLYVFRIQYFDGNDWILSSELKTVAVEQVTDAWDPHFTSKHLTLSGTSIAYKDGQTSSYGKRIVSEGIHTWTIKADVTSGYTLFGVWKSQFDPLVDTWFENSINQSYAVCVHNGKLLKPSAKGGYLNNEEYFQSGNKKDITIKMTLNLVDCTLSYTVNGTDCGKAFDVERTSYRMAATLYYKGTRFNLVSYDCSF